MKTIAQIILNELRWFAGREANFTTIFTNDNGYEYYHEGKAEITLRVSKGLGEVIDILLTKDDCCKGSTLETSQLKDYSVQNRLEHGYLLHKTLTIYLKDGSMVTLAAENVDESDPQETDIELSEPYIRYLFHLPTKTT